MNDAIITSLADRLPPVSPVRLGRAQGALYNVLERVRTLVDRDATAGPHTGTLDASDGSAGPDVLRFTGPGTRRA